MSDWRKRITVEPGKRSGKRCIRGMRITVGDVLGNLANGMSFDEIMDDFPEVTREESRNPCPPQTRPLPCRPRTSRQCEGRPE